MGVNSGWRIASAVPPHPHFGLLPLNIVQDPRGGGQGITSLNGSMAPPPPLTQMLRPCSPKETHMFGSQALDHIFELGHQKEIHPILMILRNISFSLGFLAVLFVLWKFKWWRKGGKETQRSPERGWPYRDSWERWHHKYQGLLLYF